MKKIIAAFDGLKYSESTCGYATFFASQTDTHLVGVFLDDPSYTSYKIYELIVSEGVSETRLKKFEQKDKEKREEATHAFEQVCQQRGLRYAIHHDRKIAIQALKHESIYADMLIIDAKETLTHHEEKPPTRFIRDLLGDAQCPVLLVPQQYHPIQKIILLYDGEPSSVHAIKMFSYLFPEFKKIETEVFSVKPVNATLHLPDNKLMKEFMKQHYPGATYKVIKGWAEEEIVAHLKQQAPGTLVITGAYRRSNVSRWFRESMADILMKEIGLPLFIAHNK